MNRIFAATIVAVALFFAMGCAAMEPAEPMATDATDHMVAEAMLTAQYIAAALEAGKSAEEINSVLAAIADATVISEFWVSDEDGLVEFTNVPGLDFRFPTDPDAGTQAAPFASLLLGREKVVTQGMQPREADGAQFQYVGVAGVDQPRIVQVGLAGQR